MNVVQTAFVYGRMQQSLVPLSVVKRMYPSMTLRRRPIAENGDGSLILAWRHPRSEDFVNGRFVGDHACPDDDSPHVHGWPL